MTSWRDGLGATAQDDLDRLLDSALTIARGNLAQASEFDPFALVVDDAGRLLATDWDTSALGKHPDVEEVIAAAIVQLREIAPSSRATAMVINTQLLQDKTDAVEVRLEHRDGAAVVVLLRYKRARFGPRVDYGELSAFVGTPEVWV
ncbi:hypothetical protein BH11ACT4_BH11ACT4_20800 [soil metagenome]